MIFDIQRFASVTINPGQTYVTATTTDQAYTLRTNSATPQVDVDSLSEEIQALLATGTATGTVGDVTVAIDAEGNITAEEGVDPASLIGQTVSFVGEVGEQTATIGNATAITATTDEGTAAAGEYTLRADATYTTAFIVTVDESGAVTSVSYFDGTTTQTTSTSVIAGQTLYGEVPDPTTGDATAGVDNAYAAATAINGLASDTNTANLTYSATDGTVSYQKDGAAIEGNSYSVTNYSAYTATAANFNLTFDNTGKLTAVEGGKVTEDGTGFTVGESTDTYTVTATAGDGTLSGTLTTPAGAAIPVEFTATSTVKEVGFDVDANGTVDLTVTYTDGTANKESDTYAGITYTFTNASDTYTATSSVGAAMSATTEVAATTGLGTESTATGTTTTSTLYSGETSADIKFNDTTHTLTFSYADGVVTGASDGTTALTLSDGKYTLDSATGLAVAVAEDAFADGTLVASELTVTTTWNNGSDTTITDSATTSWSDGITTTLNGEGNVVTYKLDDTHYYKFLLGTNNALMSLGTNTVGIEGISGKFTASTAIAFSSDGTNYQTVNANVSGNTLTGLTGDLKGLQVVYDSSAETLTITPQTGIFTLGTGITAAASVTLDTSSLGSLNVTAASKSNFTSGKGSVGITLTAPKYESGVTVGGETYSITFDNLAGYTSTGATAGSSPAAYYGGTVTVKTGTNSTTFTANDLTAWLSAAGTYNLGQNGLVNTSGYEVTATLGTNGSYTYAATTTKYEGPTLQFNTAKDTLTYTSTNATGSAIKASDSKVVWTLTNGGGVTVTNAAHIDADATKASDAGSYTGDGITGTLDSYTLTNTTSDTLAVKTTQSLAGVANVLDLLGTIGTGGVIASTADGSVNVSTDFSSAKTKLTGNGTALTENTTASTGTLKATESFTYKWNSSGSEPDSEGPGLWQFTLGTNVLTFGTGTSGMSGVVVNGTSIGINENLLKALLWTESSSGTNHPGVFSGLFGTNKSASDTTKAYVATITTDTTKAMSTITISNGSDDVLTMTAEAYLNGSTEVASRSQLSGLGTQSYQLTSGVSKSTFSPVALSTNAQTITLSSSGATSSASSAATASVTAKLTFSIASGGSTSVYTMDGLPLIADPNGTGQDHVKYTLANWAGANATITGTAANDKFAYDSTTGIAFPSTYSANNLEVTNTWNLPTAILNDTDVTLSAIQDGTIKVYENITLDGDSSGKTYAVAVRSDSDTVLAVANRATSTDSYTAVTDATFIFDNTTNTIAQTSGASTYFLDLTKDALGDLAYIKFTMGGDGKLSKIQYLDSGKKDLTTTTATNQYTLKTESGTKATLTGVADTDVTLTVTYAKALYDATKTDGTVVTGSNGSDTAAITTALGSGFTASASNGGVTAGSIYQTASGVASGYGSGEALTTTSIITRVINATDVEVLKGLDAASSGFAKTLANDTIGADTTYLEVSLGGKKFYIAGKLEGTTFTATNVYNEAGVVATENEGLYFEDEKLKVGSTGDGVELKVTYNANAKTYSIATASTGLSNLATIINMSEDGTINGVEQNVYSNAASMGFGTNYTDITTAAGTDPTNQNISKYLNATHLTTTITSADALNTALTEATAIDYEVKEGGNYTGIIALGSDASNGTMKTYAQLVDAEGANVTGLYAKYTFGTDGKFAIDGLYTDKGATTLSTNAAYAFSGNTITFGTSSDTAITYTLTAGTYSDVTISLTSGTPTLSTSAITNIVTAEGGSTSEASDVVFDLTDDISYTVNTETKTMTLTMGTATFTEAMDSDNTVSYDSTDTGYRYTATWNDTTGDGVTTDDTITVVTTALSDTTKMTATATVTLPINGTDVTVTLTASETGTVTVTANTSSGTTVVDPTAYGYTVALVDADSSTTVSKGDYFTYTSLKGDTVSGTTVASTETGTLGDVTGVVRYSSISTDGTTTYTFASDATVTAAAEFTINGVTYTANADGTVSRKATEAEAIALEQTGVTSDTTTYTLVYDATASTITLTNTATGASEVTAVTLASEAYITGVDGSKIMIDSAWEQQEDGTYTLTSGNTTYTYTPADEDAGTAATCTYITVNDPTAYTFSENEGSEPTLLAADGSVLSGIFSGTYTTVKAATTGLVSIH